ncbi:MAG: response regulator [Cyclobacteriaceae bacterium]|nr:response regulator [Cyclobacteriaceae bacterium]
MQEEIEIFETNDQAPSGKKEFNILYVDDETSNLRIFRMGFKRFYNVYTVDNGFEAIEVLRSNDIHLIISDQKMPEMTGTELLERTIDEFPDVVRIILTGFADIEAIVQAINKCGIYRYITKPYDQGEMKFTLDKALEGHKLKREKAQLVDKLARANEELEEKVRERTSELEEVNQHLTSGLMYAKRIQQSLLPKEETLTNAFSDHFVIYNPMNHVGGDFYWYSEEKSSRNDLQLLAVIDCMGHGVPGALLSIFGESQLEQIVNDKRVFHTDSILSMMDEGVLDKLAADNKETSETMDGSIIVIDRKNKKLEFSGAKLDLIYFKDGEMNRIRGTKMSLGSVWDEKLTFERHQFDLEGITEVYLFSDGLQDQVSDKMGKKFGSKQLFELMQALHADPMAEQKAKIMDQWNEWRGDTMQVDDITLIGIRI